MIKKLLLRLSFGSVLLSSLLYFTVPPASADWLDRWDKRVKITINGTNINETLTNFPVLIHLSTNSGENAEDVSFVFDELGSNTNRKKIAVTTTDGTNQCYVEIEKWDHGNEQAWLWTKVPNVASNADTDLYLYYDNGQADNTNYVGDTPNLMPEEINPTEIYDDDETFWGLYQAGSGSYGITISEETTEVKKGTSSLKMTVSAGSYVTVGIYHTYGIAQDWSKGFLCFWFYGANTGKTWGNEIFAPDVGNRYVLNFLENFNGWKRIIIPLDKMSKIGNPNSSTVTYIHFVYIPTATNIHYLDRVIVDEDFSSVGENVWEDNVKMVQHLEDVTVADNLIKDSSSKDNDGTKVGVDEPIEIDGKVSKAQNFDGGNDYVNLGNVLKILGDKLTVSVWVKPTLTSQWKGIIGRSTSGWGTYSLGLTDGNAYKFYVVNSSGTSGQVLVAATNGVFEHIVGVYDGVNVKIYKNGVETVGNSLTGDLNYGTYAFWIGRNWDGTCNAIIDEARIYNEAKSASWIKADYETQRDQLLDFGIEENRPIPGTVMSIK